MNALGDVQLSRGRAESILVACALAGSVLVSLQLDNAGVLAIGLLLLLLPAILVLLVAPEFVFNLLVVGSLVVGAALASTAIDVGVRIYPLDLILALALVAGGLHLRAGSDEVPALSRRQIWVVIGILIFGVACAAVGAASRHPLLEIIGTYRRMFFYPVIGFVIGMVFLRRPEAFARMHRLTIIAGLLLFLVFLGRLITGVGYQQDAYSVKGETIRYLSYNEAAALTFALLCVTSARYLSQSRRERNWLLILAVAFAIGVIGSNYRAAWLAMLAGLFALAFAIGLRRLRVAMRLLVGSLLALTCLTTILLLTPLGAAVVQKFGTANLLTTGSWRLFSWLKALSVFVKHPALGVGLGYKHEFVRLAGDMQTLRVNEGNTIHNDILWVLVNTGLVGGAILGVTWATLLRGAARVVRHSGDAVIIALTTAAVGELAALLVTSLLQPTVSLGSSGVLLGLIAALFCRAAEFAAAPAIPPIPDQHVIR